MNQPYARVNQPYATLTLASALREMFGVQLYRNNARALLSRILSILNLDWLQHAWSVWISNSTVGIWYQDGSNGDHSVVRRLCSPKIGCIVWQSTPTPEPDPNPNLSSNPNYNPNPNPDPKNNPYSVGLANLFWNLD